MGVPDRRGDRPGPRGRAVRHQLRPDRAGARGRLRRDLSLQCRSPRLRARRAPRPVRAGPDPAGVRVRLLRVDQPPAGADPPSHRRGHAAQIPRDRSAARDGRGLLSRHFLREGAPPGGGHRMEILFTGASDPVRAQLARGRRGGDRGTRVLRARPGPGPAALRGRAALRRRCCRGRARVSSTGCPPVYGRTSSASPSGKGRS